MPPASNMLLFVHFSQALGEQKRSHSISSGKDDFPQTLPGLSLLEAEMGTGYFSTEVHGVSVSQGDLDSPLHFAGRTVLSRCHLDGEPWGAAAAAQHKARLAGLMCKKLVL